VGALLLLVVVSVLESNRRAQEIYAQLDQVNQRYHEVEAKLRRMRSDVNMSGIFVRDYLLDPDGERADAYRAQLADFKAANTTAFRELRTLISGPETNAQLNSLRAKLQEYWQALDPLLDWTPAEKLTQSFRFLRSEVIPRLDAVLAIAQEIEETARLSAV